MTKIILRTFPPDEYVRLEKNRPVAVQFNCQFCGAKTRMNWQPMMFQMCMACRDSGMAQLFTFDLLPHSQLINLKEDIR